MDKPPNNQDILNERRRLSVKLRLQGQKIADIEKIVELSAPTIIAAHKLFLQGGWPAVDVSPRGRSKGKQQALPDDVLTSLKSAAQQHPAHDGPANGLPWTLKLLEEHCRQNHQTAISARSLGKYVVQWGLGAENLHTACKDSGQQTDWLNTTYKNIVRETRKSDSTIFWVGHKLVDSNNKQTSLLYAHSTRGQYFWLLNQSQNSLAEHLINFLQRLSTHADGSLCVILHGIDISANADVQQWLSTNNTIKVFAHPAIRATDSQPQQSDNPTDPEINSIYNTLTNRHPTDTKRKTPTMSSLTHLQRLEAESIHIMREVVANSDKPVMLYSIGKDSAVMLHLAMKAFYPAKLPFALLHVDTGWKFQAMYEFRDKMVRDLKLELITHTNPEGLEKGVNPFTHGSSLHTDIMKTQGLRQALDKYGFDAAFGGARRDEEQSRAKERIFSFRTEQHRWDPKNQRPELWNLYNTKKMKGESIRVFPISNWTELDVWQYIHKEGIPIVPLYYAAQRPVVMRDGSMIMVDDDRMPMNTGEVPMIKNVRFRTLGCYPLTGAVESNATTLPDIIQEMLLAKTSERQGRMIDHDSAASMEKKKQEGYF